MILEAAFILAGAYFILKGADWVSDAAVDLARMFKTTNVAVGILLVSVVLSLPELLVAVFSVAKGHPSLAIGVSIGSVVINLGLIVGIAAIIKPIRMPRHVVARDVIFMVSATLVVALLGLGDYSISRRDGIIFLVLFIPYVINVFEQERMLAQKERKKESEDITKTLQMFGHVNKVGVLVFNDSRIIFIVGLAMLLVGTQLFTDGIIGIVQALAVPEVLIGITLGALGPSIPNLAAAFSAARKNQEDLVVSESVGSNTFTLLVTLGFLSIISPLAMDPATALVTIPALVAITFVFLIFSLSGWITREAGAVLLAFYALSILLEFIARG